MPERPHFLVIDDNSDSRFLLVKTLLRKFPAAVIKEGQSAESATAAVRSQSFDALIVHRSTEMAGVALVAELRSISPQMPIVMVSSIDRRAAAAAAGANAFLLYDEWLRIGTVVSALIERQGENTTPPFRASGAAQTEAKPAAE